MAKSKDLIKKHTESVTHNTLGNIITVGLAWGGAAVMSALATYSGFISGLPLYLLIFWGAVIFLIFAAALNFIHLFVVRRRRPQATSSDETGLQTVESDEKRIETLNAQHQSEKSELERKVDALEKLNEELKQKNQSEMETLSAQHQSQIASLESKHSREIYGRDKKFDSLEGEISRLKDEVQTQEMRCASRDEELKQYEWLHNMANEQANDIGRYVVAQVRYCFYELNAPIPYVNFAVDIRNNSVFDITIEEAIGGYIRLAGERLRGEKELVHHPKISPSGEGSLTLKQRLLPEEGNLVAYCESQALGAIYYFEELVIMIASRTEFPQFERTRLKLPQHIGSKDTPLSKEIDSLKAQLEEKAKRTKPDITGKVSEVYSEWWAIAGQGDSNPMRFDYHFIVNVYLANHGAVTTIEQFKPVLKVGEHSYDGERERNIHDVEDDEMNWRAWGANELDDLEKLNDVPLEHTRNGWLWFVVKGVPNTKDKSEMKLELSVIDKDGTSYYLDTVPQPQWQDNPFLKKARMDEARARMRAQW